MMRLFASGRQAQPGAKIVYVDGAFDMFHMGHIEMLKKAKAMGDYLIVGINDNTVNKHRGLNYPILNMVERVLSVLGCKHVDDVLMDAPWCISKQLIQSLKISIVATGTKSDYRYDDRETESHYTAPKEMGILERIESTSALTMKDILARILKNEEVYQRKFDKKNKKEEEYYAQRYNETTPKK